MAKSIAYKHQLRALARWPKDPLRPEQIQFQNVMRKRLDQRLGLANAAASDASVASTTPIAAGWNEAQELEQANALYSFIGNRYAQKYPLTTLLKPASNPTYYEDLVRELEEAPKRTWFQRMTNSWKGFLRWK